LLSNERRVGLTDDQRKAAQAVTLAQYIAQEKGCFILRYKSQVVAGLGIVGKSPLKTSAQEALKQMVRGKR